MAILKQLLELDELTSLSDSVVVLVQPVGASKAYKSTVGAIRAGLAPLSSPSFSGVVTVPTATTEDSSTKAASTLFVDNKARSLISSLKQIKQIQSSVLLTTNNISTTTFSATGLSLNFTPTRSDSLLLIDICLSSVTMLLPSVGATNHGVLNLGWSGSPQLQLSDVVAFVSSPNQYANAGSVTASLLLFPSHNGLPATLARNYQIFAKVNTAGGTLAINHGTGGVSTITIQEIVV